MPEIEFLIHNFSKLFFYTFFLFLKERDNMKIDTINYNFTFTAGKVQANREQLRSEVIKYLNLGKSVKEITGLVPVKESFIYRI